MRRSVMSTAECQDAIFEVAVELARQDRRLAQIATAIQLPRDFELDAELPSTTEIELYSCIAAVKADYLERSVESLLAAAQVSDSDLRLDFIRECRSGEAPPPRRGWSHLADRKKATYPS